MDDYLKEVTDSSGLSVLGGFEKLNGGMVGNVFRFVDPVDKRWIVKFNSTQNDAEDIDEKLYGSDPVNFDAAYNNLKSNHIPVPEVLSSGITSDGAYQYILMSELTGDLEDYSNSWFSEIGYWLGKIHSITKINDDAWEALFALSIRSRLEKLRPHIKDDLYQAIKNHIDNMLPGMSKVPTLSLSHLDGFQGIFKNENGTWSLVGVYDIEDHQFTDQRFVLAGFELNMKMKGFDLPESFWLEYQKHCHIDDSFKDTKDIFKLYYLLVWAFVLNEDEYKFAENIRFIREMVG